jgi:hypothetical protein
MSAGPSHDEIPGFRLHPATYLFAARALRDFGDGFVAILLPIYLLALGLSPMAVPLNWPSMSGLGGKRTESFRAPARQKQSFNQAWASWLISTHY